MICGRFTRPSLCMISFACLSGAVRELRSAAKTRGFRKMIRIPAIALRNGRWQLFSARGRVVSTSKNGCRCKAGLGGASGNAVAALLALERALKKELAGRREVANRGRGGFGSAVVSGRRDCARGWTWRRSLSAARFAGDDLCGGDAGDWGFDAEGVWGLGCDGGAGRARFAVVAIDESAGRARLQSGRFKSECRGFSRWGLPSLLG